MTIRQHALASVLEDVTGSRSPSPAPLTHVQEQKKLRAETVAAFHTAVKSEDEEEEDLLIPRSKTKDEIEREEEEYRAFLEREVGEDLSGLITVEDTDGAGASGSGAVDVKEERTKKKSKKSKNKNAKSKHEDDQEFLMKYVDIPPRIHPDTQTDYWAHTATSLTGGGSTKLRAGSLLTTRSPTPPRRAKKGRERHLQVTPTTSTTTMSSRKRAMRMKRKT